MFRSLVSTAGTSVASIVGLPERHILRRLVNAKGDRRLLVTLPNAHLSPELQRSLLLGFSLRHVAQESLGREKRSCTLELS